MKWINREQKSASGFVTLVHSSINVNIARNRLQLCFKSNMTYVYELLPFTSFGMIPVIMEDTLSDGSHARHAIDSVKSRRIVMSTVR